MSDMFKPTVEGLSRKTRRRLYRENMRRNYAVNPVMYTGNFTSNNERGHSGFWSDCPIDELKQDANKGFFQEDDFLDFGFLATQTTQISVPRYKVYSSTNDNWRIDSMPTSMVSDTVGPTTPVAGQGGVISSEQDAAGDHSAIGTHQCPILLTTTQAGKVWFEARIAVSSVSVTAAQIFCGLAENSTMAFGTAVPLADANATSATGAMIGFNRLEDGLTVINTSYADHAAVWTDIQATASTGVLAASTWIKLGMKINFKDTARCVRFYVNNIECTTAMTKAALLATTFLDVVPMGPCLAQFADGANFVYLDWWSWAQQY